MDQNQQPIITNGNGDKKVGPIIATLIIVLILIIAALYIFASKINQPETPLDDTTAVESNIDGSLVPQVTGNADDVTSLENDLNLSTDGLDNQNF